jgi:hypothetical protein
MRRSLVVTFVLLLLVGCSGSADRSLEPEPNGLRSRRALQLRRLAHKREQCPVQVVARRRNRLFADDFCLSPQLSTLQADGSGLRTFAALDRAGLFADASPDGRLVIYKTLDVLRLLGRDGALLREVVVGHFALPLFPSPYRWSPDSRYVALAVPPSKDGPCMQVENPQPMTVGTP